MHWRYCGTSSPDRFLLEAAHRFVTEFIGDTSLSDNYKKKVVRVRGSSASPSRARPGAGEMWIKLFSEYQGDECIVFPFSTPASPRGFVTFNFKQMEAHRAMCLMVNKLPPEPKMMALHKCGNGHLGCVTPKHLYWGDGSDNAKDAYRHKVEGKPDCFRSNPRFRNQFAA